jgi:hypothetical protein
VAVALFLAAALSLATVRSAQAAVIVKGFPVWAEPLARRSLNAVWEQIPSSQPPEERARVLALVGERLFEGYTITSIDVGADPVTVAFRPLEERAWTVALIAPSLSSPLDGWFVEDLQGADAVLAGLLEGLPPSALSWAGRTLEEAVDQTLRARLPGWRTSTLFRSEGGAWSLEVRFIPEGTLLLAFEPRLSSMTLPVSLLRTDLKEDVHERLEPLLGLPVDWLGHHSDEIELWAGERLRERSVVDKMKGQVDVSFKAERISAVDVAIESHRYVLWAWASAYAGTEDRYPEVGLHLGRRATPFSGWEGELYYEGVLEMNDFSLENRWGFRWSPWGDVWLGAELVYPGERLWGRVSLGGRIGSPYLWWRFSEEDSHNLGLGYRLNEYISLELHYDGDDDDSLSLRAVGNL